MKYVNVRVTAGPKRLRPKWNRILTEFFNEWLEKNPTFRESMRYHFQLKFQEGIEEDKP